MKKKKEYVLGFSLLVLVMMLPLALWIWVQFVKFCLWLIEKGW